LTNVNAGAIAAGKTLTLQGAGNGSISGTMSSAGGVAKAGTGTWTLTGANTYTGATTVIDGTLKVVVAVPAPIASYSFENNTANGGFRWHGTGWRRRRDG